MYDVDGNGTIEPEEMSRIVHSIYAMMGPDQVRTKMWIALKTKLKLFTH